jgi:hypothetical protein
MAGCQKNINSSKLAAHCNNLNQLTYNRPTDKTYEKTKCKCGVEH